MKISIGLLAALLMAPASGALAQSQTVAVCGAVKGQAYFFDSGLVRGKSAGWSDDGISNGRITLSKTGKDEYDVVYSDASGGAYSSRGEGAVVVPGPLSTDQMSILLFHPQNVIEVYQFVRDRTGKARVALLQSKGTDSITKASVMVGECSVFDPQ